MARARLLIVCTGNSARSQIAEGLFRHEAGERFEVFSAAREKCRVFPRRIQVLHWPFDDPARAPEGSDARINEFRRVRDRIHSWIMVFLGEIAPGLERGSVGQ
jgi:protein-tyrosine-phosphatase